MKPVAMESPLPGLSKVVDVLFLQSVWLLMVESWCSTTGETAWSAVDSGRKVR
jgi:hypothetical protein